MRPTCMDCVRKHLAQAHVLLDEFASDPDYFEAFFWFAMGHIAEAESECQKYQQFAHVLRAHRRRMIEDDDFVSDFEPLIKLATRYAFLENEVDVDVDEMQSLLDICSEPVMSYICSDCE